jgi:hypothetical protein
MENRNDQKNDKNKNQQQNVRQRTEDQQHNQAQHGGGTQGTQRDQHMSDKGQHSGERNPNQR